MHGLYNIKNLYLDVLFRHFLECVSRIKELLLLRTFVFRVRHARKIRLASGIFMSRNPSNSFGFAYTEILKRISQFIMYSRWKFCDIWQAYLYELMNVLEEYCSIKATQKKDAESSISTRKLVSVELNSEKLYLCTCFIINVQHKNVTWFINNS